MEPSEFLSNLTSSEQLLILEVVNQVYKDGNLYEWFCNITDLDPDDARELFESVREYMKMTDERLASEKVFGYNEENLAEVQA